MSTYPTHPRGQTIGDVGFGGRSEYNDPVTGPYANDCRTTAQDRFAGIVGYSPALMETLRLVETVAATDASVLIEGETGTGKELIAQAVHQNSPRRNRPLIKLNCAAVPTELLESELFGHEKGAFTGALAKRLGRFEAAHGGTLFLDEIGDTPLELQTKLLRVLQESEFERLGSTQTQRGDVRIVAATNQDLWKLVSEQRFRSDLFLSCPRLPDCRTRSCRTSSREASS